jgi:hypothetical protein
MDSVDVFWPFMRMAPMDSEDWMVLLLFMLFFASLAGIPIWILSRKDPKHEEWVKGLQEEERKEEQRQRDVHKQFEDEFGKRKQAIGKIVCPQCKWTGNWGDGMSYQEFFAYELHVKYKVEIDETLIRDADNLSNESQYKCPMCKSTNWQKV